MTTPDDRSTWDYYDGGADEEITLVENERAWRAVRFLPHVLRGAGPPDTAIELLGSRIAGPVLVAPTALHGLAHPDGEAATRVGASRAGSLMVLSTRSSVPLEDVSAAAPGPWWFQVYAMRDHDLTLELAARAAAAGAGALVLTGDTPVVGRKKRAAPGLDVAALHLEHLRAQTGRDLGREDVEQDPEASTRLIRQLQEASGLPVLVKGVLRGDDALLCIDEGAAGVIVSNHGGRQLDRTLPTALALPSVADAVQGRVPVLVDGGIRTGTDVLAALALGADAALVGRPVLHALSDGGAAGVEHLLASLLDALAHAMALAGASRPGEVPPDLVARFGREPFPTSAAFTDT